MPLRFGATHVAVLCLTFLSVGTVSAATAITAASNGEIGVRIDKSETALLAAAATESTRKIDYGTFEWHIFDRTAFERLVAGGATFSSVPVDYRLTLGGAVFDPKTESPDFPAALKAAPTTGASIRLVQLVGPTQSEWVQAMQTAGLRIVQYIHPFTYVVWGDAEAIDRIGGQSWLRWSGPFEPAFALLPAYRSWSGESVLTRLLIVEHADLESIAGALRAAGATDIAFAAPSRSLVNANVRIDADRYAELARIPGVYSVKPVPLDGGPRSEMSCLVNINSLDEMNRAVGDYPGWLNLVGLDGTGVIVANVEAGQLTTHPDLINRFISCTGTTCTGTSSFVPHGTHTAGILAGDAASGVMDGLGFLRGLGVAPGASLLNQFWLPHYASAGGMLLIMRDSVSNGASASGNAWGPAGFPQGYDDDTRQVDVGVRDVDEETPGDQSITYVLSILNGGGGVSSLGSPDEGKNLIDVGSTKMQNNDGTQNLEINDVSFNSGHGPCLDGRKAPHLVAPGCIVDGPISPSGYSSSNIYCGTSFASPQVTGGVALFIEYYRMLPDYVSDPSPALVKAAVLGVARSLEGNDDADGNTLGPPYDSKQGYGRYDLESFVSPQNAVLYFDQQVVFGDSGEEWSVTVLPDDAGAPMRIMLVWTDAPGHGLGGPTPAWNNDLDLVVDAGGSVYRGNVIGTGGFSTIGGLFDSRDNTEGVFLGPTAPSVATIRVRAVNINSDGLPNVGDATDQDFALACYNCTLVPTSMCTGLPGDLTESAGINGADIGGFLSCYLGGDPTAGVCGCADMDRNGLFEQSDIVQFVDCLLADNCP